MLVTIPDTPQMPRQLVARDAHVPEELLPEEMQRLKPRFVPVNPEAPTHQPPDTRNTGAATQRAAQPVPDSQRSDMPKIAGETEESNQIVNNIPREFLPAHQQPEPGRPLGKPEADAIQDAPAQVPSLPADSKPGTNTSKIPAGEARTDEAGLPQNAAEGTHEKKSNTDSKSLSQTNNPPPKKPETLPTSQAQENKGKDENENAVKPAIVRQGNSPDNLTPAPRPQAAKVGTFSLLARRPTGTNEAGTLALDSRYSEFGDYAQRMVEIIQASWWLSLMRTKHREANHAVVIIEFTLRKDGTLHDVVIKESTASQAGAYICKDAIESRTPFDPWTPEMIATLGDEDRGRFTFHYR